MWRLLCHHVFLISSSFSASDGACFVVVAFPGYLGFIFYVYLSISIINPHR